MKKIFFFIFAIISLFTKNTFAQGTGCATASPFCTAVPASFPAGINTVAPTGPNYGCLASQPNPAWFYLQVSSAGSITLSMANSANADIDFVMWGPFTSAAAGCASGLPASSLVYTPPFPSTAPGGCSYSGTNVPEVGYIASALVGQVYILLITNYSNQPTTISLTQTGGVGATNCSIVCSMNGITAVPGACTSPNNLFDITGVVSYTNPPTSGTLTISNSCSSATQVINAPFNATSASYTLTGLPANGAACTVSAVFSANPTCTFTQSFTTPPPCFVLCPFQVDSARVCIGLPATLTASGATSYVWSTGASTANITVAGKDSTYTVIGSTGTCKDTMTTRVTTFPPPTVIFSANKHSGCDTLSVNFSADTTGNSGATYSWNLGESAIGDGSKTSHLYTTYGCHNVELTASFGPGCSTTHTDSCMINVFPPPAARFTVSPNEIDILSPTAYFTNTSTNSTNWIWNFGDTTGSILQNPDHTYHSVGFYPVKLYASSVNGCIDSANVSVEIKDVITCYIPNSFTPNKNGINDLFNIYSYGISSDSFELLIFDRWGTRVFKTNDMHEGWNGAMNNGSDVLEAAIYVYHLNYKEINGKQHNIVGLVSLIR